MRLSLSIIAGMWCTWVKYMNKKKINNKDKSRFIRKAAILTKLLLDLSLSERGVLLLGQESKHLSFDFLELVQSFSIFFYFSV